MKAGTHAHNQKIDETYYYNPKITGHWTSNMRAQKVKTTIK